MAITSHPSNGRANVILETALLGHATAPIVTVRYDCVQLDDPSLYGQCLLSIPQGRR